MIFFREQLFTGKSLYWGDIGLYFVPMLDHLHQSLLAGRVPLWNPWILCGAPYVGNPQTWPLYPGAALFGIWGARQAIGWDIALHAWLAGVGMYLLARRAARAGWAAALLASLTYMFGGHFVSKEQFPNMLQAEAYVPWLLYFADRALTTLRRRDALAVGAALGLQLLAAHAQITLLTIYLVAIYCGWRIPGLRPWTRPRVLRLVSIAAMAALVAVCLDAGQLLPTIELYQNAWRQNLSFKIVDRFYLPWNQLGNFVAPTAHGHPIANNFTARGNFWETCCYIGALPAIAALAAMAGAWRRGAEKAAPFWTVVFVLGVWLATGKDGHLYYVAYKALPGFKSFHDPARCLLWASVAAALLAAIGLDAAKAFAARRGWGTGQAPRWVSAVVLLIAFVDLAHFGGDIYPLASQNSMAAHGLVTATVRADPMVRAHQARIMAPDSARVWQRFTAKRSYQSDLSGYGRLWRETLTPNLGMELGVADAYGYEPETRLDTQMVSGGTAVALGPNASDVQRHGAAAYAGAMAVRYLITDRTEPPDARLPGVQTLLTAPTAPFATHPEEGSGQEHLSLNTRWLPRCRLAGSIVSGGSAHDAMLTIARGLNGQGAAVDLQRDTEIAGAVGPQYSRRSIRAVSEIRDLDPEHVSIDVTTDGPAALVLADTMHPGWTATVDGRPATIRSADGFLRAMLLPSAGRHRVNFVYRPASFQAGLYLTLLTMSLLAACVVYIVSARNFRGNFGRKSPA
ncbi:hypothetical protein CCAX7_39080 [Capsulimonas corticalis]|uniref:Uncharacterized protein n=1 Tax=Capsulimonas corticalis TaxID=2219043 RepID=A0A402D3L0_9BACT|nr:hypothetical protein [Capsulimonas corticalis]BDI31857.1 hypothetical protein CCAX7_39080 [Capsulimonas corticalis]